MCLMLVTWIRFDQPVAEGICHQLGSEGEYCELWERPSNIISPIFLLRTAIQDACGASFMYLSTIIGVLLRKDFTSRVKAVINMLVGQQNWFSFSIELVLPLLFSSKIVNVFRLPSCFLHIYIITSFTVGGYLIDRFSTL